MAHNTQPQPPFFIGVDVGGTTIKVGIVDDNGRSLSKSVVPTEVKQPPEIGMANLERCVRDAVQQSGLTMDDMHSVGLATPGTMDIAAGMLLTPGNLPAWHGFQIRQHVQNRLQKPTVLQNDANAAAFGEFWVGTARDAPSAVMWTLGTGVGCGIIIHDVVIEGQHSHGGESGHMIVQMDGGRSNVDGRCGTLEAYCSATALVKRCREAIEAGADSSLRATLDAGQEITAKLIADAAEAGDELADRLVMDTARILGVATVSLMHTIDPSMILIGGAMTFGRHDNIIGRRFLQRLKDEVHALAFPIPAAKTRIDYAILGGDAGYIGAAGCARQRFTGKTPSGATAEQRAYPC
ncbi:glucokinase [Planctomycetia bacterium]|nr:glucokinase [Planctomycetia bacterium]